MTAGLNAYFDVIQQLPQAERRPAQEQMVAAIGKALANKKSLVVEAGTGSGKSFGYLIPALLQESRPVVISTGTIALQEQLLQKDIPFLCDALGQESLEVTLVKGRSNYLCIQKLLELERELSPVSGERLHLEYLKTELQAGWDGDWATLDLPVPRELWEEVYSDSEDCLGPKCRFYRENPYRKSRENLKDADVIIANHALYLQDLVSGQSLLPPHDVVIFDEAHNIKHYALNAFTARIGKYATHKLLRKIQRRLLPVPDAFLHQIQNLEAALLEWLFQAQRTTFRLVTDDTFLSIVSQYVLILQEVEQWVRAIQVKQLPCLENELALDRAAVQRNKLLQQLQGLILRWEFFLLPDPFQSQRVNWAEVDLDRLYYELKSTPLNIAEVFKNTLWSEKTAILTSATLSTERSLHYFKAELGIDEAQELILPSPFDYKSQCLLYLPKTLPEPNDWRYPIAITEEMEKILLATQGRAFVLFTSVQNMKIVSNALIPRLPFPCRVQGELPRNRLIDWFKATPHSVLFATATFWEGIDIPGDSLSCVIIDKVPFTSPEEPVNQAMVDYLKQQGRDWFREYVLPNAIIKLKQGFGRLIRTKTDRGVVAILDPRLHTKGYGRKILQSLPNVTTVTELTPESLMPA